MARGSQISTLKLACFMVISTCGAGTAFAAAPWTPDDNGCSQQPTTVAIVGCMDARTRLWDARLNQAWKAVNAMLQDPSMKGRIPSLQKAQRLWLQYRDANCGFYETEDGTIRQIEVASCMLRMTQDRAIELQAMGPQ